MRLVETDDALLIDPSAENLPGLAEPPPYAASPSPTRWLFNHGDLTWNPVTTAENDAAAAAAAALTESEMSEEGETTSVFHHLQTDSGNTDCDLLLDMAGGMMKSPPRPRPGMNFCGEEALFHTPDFHTDMGMGGGMMMSMSPPRMMSGDSIGNSDPFTLWNFADHSEVQELENRKGMMMMPNWKQPCIEEVDAGQNQSLGIWAAENMGGMVQTQRSDDHSVNNVDEWFQLAGGMNYSLASVDDSLPLGLGGSFEPYRFLDDSHDRLSSMRATISWIAVDSELLSHKEFWLNIGVQAMEKGLPVADTDVNLFCKFKCTTLSLIQVEIGMRGMLIEQKSFSESLRCDQWGVYSIAALEFLKKEFVDTSEMASLELEHQSSLKRQFLDNLESLVAELKKIFNLKRGLAELEKIVVKIERLLHELKEIVNLERLVAELKKIVNLERLVAESEKIERLLHVLEEIIVNLKRLVAELEKIERLVDELEGIVNLERLVDELEKIFINLERLVDELEGIVNLERLVAELEKIFVNLERLADELEEIVVNLEMLAAELKKSYTVCNLAAVFEAECGMMQLDSPCEPHIPKSSTETNNNIDAKGGNSSSHKTISRCRWEKDHGINRQVLQQLFGKSRDAAAKTLKVSTSTLKRACRHFGITRWPNHSKGKMPNCSLNQKQHVQAVKKHKGIQPCPALPPLQATNTSQCNNIMSIKVTYKNDTIRFPLSSSASTMKYLEEQLETKLKISLENFCIKYQDEEDEWITLTCDSELLHGLDVLRSCGKMVIRMMVTPKFN